MVAVTRSLADEVLGGSRRRIVPLRHLQVFTPRNLARLAPSARFSHVDVEPTGANTHRLGTPSAAIEGSHRGEPVSFFALRLRALSFQIWGSMHMAWRPDRGDACILRATP